MRRTTALVLAMVVALAAACNPTSGQQQIPAVVPPIPLSGDDLLMTLTLLNIATQSPSGGTQNPIAPGSNISVAGAAVILTQKITNHLVAARKAELAAPAAPAASAKPEEK